ncbi:uncharacterized protein BDZ99DRAFT_515346 [Mytilinidion resinicola]|uniref:Zn(2)-C6 fungal-type domain-containing protein n=1 Tax=Mytilinidion resinicola TaxID=574789 RepID=A0A6A6Z182_9PEZI|nr:uncharacterized protein BDZ99DRAFT_515346 [Mytilinidion resinicola]KAF2814558.1 hypothetical protein BDZ99DRAFT_515346 [Mytilinidion resinicola]
MEGPAEGGATGPQLPQDNRVKPTVACLRCRDQKLKCNRELPCCVRCRKQRAACSYPPPPNRKRTAQKTSQARASLSSGVEHVHPSDSSAAAQPGKRQRISIDAEGHRIPNSEDTKAAELPSTEFGTLLWEVYFNRVYNATLLFHKSIAFQLYMDDRIPDYLLRAIFAHAAIFLQQVDSPYKQYIKIFPVHTLFEKSWSWARAASREVLSLVDEPTGIRVQALQVLQTYYFSQGDIQRATVHASLAYRLVQLLGFDRLHEDVASHSTNSNMKFEREMRRRSFWAAWCSFCIGSDQSDTSRACERVIGLPLPAKFERGGLLQSVELKLSQKMEADWTLSTDSLPNQGMVGPSSCSLMAELVKVLGVWTKVQAFISDFSKRSDFQRSVEFYKLVELFDPIEHSIGLPLTDLCSRAEFYDESPELLASVCSMYYLSRLIMYASMVPILSRRPVESSVLRELVRKSADLVLQQAIKFAELLQLFVAQNLDMTRLSPISGYGAFVAGSVFLAFKSMMLSARPLDPPVQVPGPDSEEIKTIQTVLEILSIYWRPLRRLVIKLNKAIGASQPHDADLIASPTYSWSTSRPCYCFAGQSIQGLDPHENHTESYATFSGHQAISQARAATERAASRAADSGCQSASVETSLVYSDERGYSDAEWWNTAPTIDVWEWPVSLVM